jgi:PKD repeat protein
MTAGHGGIMLKRFVPLLLFLNITNLLYGIAVEDIIVISRAVLDTSGFSGDLAFDDTDGSMHFVWVSSAGELKYAVRSGSDQWSQTEIIPTNGLPVYADERSGDDRWPRKCCGLTVDEDGTDHIVYGVQDGDLYYVYGTSWQWSEPELLVSKNDPTCHPEIVAMNHDLIVIWEDTEPENTCNLYEIERIRGNWTGPRIIMYADNPDLIQGENGRVYITGRLFNTGSPDYDWDHNVLFGSAIPGYRDWDIRQITQSTYRVGKASRMAVHDGKIYLSWSTSIGAEAEDHPDTKGRLYCARAPEPGDNWNLHFSPNTDPIYTVATGDPYGVVAVYSDGTAFYANGKAGNVGISSDQSFKIWLGSRWSGLRPADWEDSVIHAASDGRTVWVISSSSRYSNGEVSVSGYINPFAERFDYANRFPEIISITDTLALAYSDWDGQCVAHDPDGDPLRFSLVYGPDGFSVDSLDGTMRYQTAGTDTPLIGIKVSDQRGKFDVRYFRLTITDQPYLAQFTAAPLEGEAPLTVQFTNTSLGPVETVLWSFGDGSNSTLLNPVHTYHDPGIYSAELVVNGSLGSDIMHRPNYISVMHSPPVALFSAEPVSGTPGLLVHFQDQSTGNITSWTWDFGDGGFSEEPSPEHLYETAGTFTVSLTVTGPGGSHQLERTDLIHIQPIEPPVALFSAEPVSGTPGLLVHFQDQSTGNITSWTWDFGDGGFSEEPSPEHLYETAGTFTVSLTVTGPGGSHQLESTDLIHIQLMRPPVALFSAEPVSGKPGLAVQFQDSSMGDITSWMWDFGDGGFSDLNSPSHVYNTSGTFTVCLIVSGPAGNDTVSVPDLIHIEAIQPPDAAFKAEPESGTAPLIVHFHNESVGDDLQYVWNFGDFHTVDGGISHEADPSYIYTQKGVYSVLLEATGPEQKDTEFRHNYIQVLDGSGIEGQNEIPDNFALYPNHPNPFNSETKFQVDIPRPVFVRISVYDARGKWIRNLVRGFQNAGKIQITWNGSGQTGNTVPSGLYLIRMEAGPFVDEMKVMMLK